MERNNNWLWVGIGVLGLAATTALVYRFYHIEQQRSREANDPRAREVRALIQEAEKLLSLGRKGAAGA
ncbi:MAG: hypothetical protein FJX76_14825 [Armatimonadetes bacterium]|nr:hypothetical protein [Armatimonadota bacterium]